ncbi:MAG: hypothetical protein WDM92_06815 [Caulobacteraceae bacterium]
MGRGPAPAKPEPDAAKTAAAPPKGVTTPSKDLNPPEVVKPKAAGPSPSDGHR